MGSKHTTRMPLSTFVGTLRHISSASLHAHGEAILRACAPLFLPLHNDERSRICNTYTDRLDPNVHECSVPARPLRRFSGDSFSDLSDAHCVDVGCSHSVCIDDAGRDDGTLALELNAYRRADVDFFAIFFDCLNAKVASTFGLPVSAHIGVLVSPPEKLLKRLPEHTPEELREHIRQAAQAGRPFGITLGCVIAQARIKRVLDLRRREAQSWFFHRYLPEGPMPTPAREFTDILPELLQPHLGGSTGCNMRWQAVGADLRAAGVNALIYPSAHNDVEVSYRHNLLTHWRGWNLILYPGNMPREGVHDDLGGWETEFRNGIVFENHKSATDDTAGWRVTGLEALHMLLYEQTMKQKGILAEKRLSFRSRLTRLWHRLVGRIG